MASNSETGHAVNISNYKFMIEKNISFDAAYNPSNPDLVIANMQTQWTTADTAHTTLTTALQNSKNPINDREILFSPVAKLVTKIINNFNSTNASTQIKKDAKGIADRIRGFGITKDKLPDGTPNPDSVSKSHLSYVQRGDAFKQFVTLLATDSNYAPNETALKVTTLTALADDMKTANDNIGSIIAPVEMTRITRDKTLYEPATGIIDTALKCKDYVKGVFGAKSPESRLITGIKFTRSKKKK